ncbi:MAG: YihY/virulence factor BrkB family protein [Mycobacteriales bacterium]
MVSPSAVLSRARERRPFLDHLIRAFGRYQGDGGDRQAAAVTFFGFLSFFPLLAVAASLLALCLGEEAVGTVVNQVNSYAPGLAEQLGLREILTKNTKAGFTGILGLAALLYSGLGWVDALREAIRVMWHHNVAEGNFVVKKAKDVLILAGLGLTVVLSVGVSAATGAFTGFALDLIGLEQTFVPLAVAKLVGVLLGLLTSTGLFLFLFYRLPKVQTPFRRVVKGALLAGALFEVLKRVGAVYIERTTENPLYGAFAVIVGLLVWINIVSRVLLLCAAWTVTGPYDSDVAPSGTASVALAHEADIDPDLVDNDPDDPDDPDDPAPPGQDAATQPPTQHGAAAASWAGQATTASPPAAVTDAGSPPRVEVLVRQAAQFSAGALGMVTMAVALHVLRTVKDLVRR